MSLNPKFITAKEAAALIPDGASIMLERLRGLRHPLCKVIDELSKTDVKDLRLIMQRLLPSPNGPDGDELLCRGRS